MSKLIRLDAVDSTNSYIKARLSDMSDGDAVTAKRQTAGRGRRGHVWSASGGMLPLSILLRDPPDTETLTARVGLGVCHAIESFYDAPPRILIKWPNDIIIDYRKVCGILCESVLFGDSMNVIVGIGVNVSQSAEYFLGEGLPNAGSLLTLTGEAPDRDELFARIVGEVISVAAKPFSECYDEFKSRLINLGRRVRIIGGGKADGVGRIAAAEDVAPNGYLICRDENGVFEVGSGEVSVRGENGYI